MSDRPWHEKTMSLVRKHKLGFLFNPGGGQFTRYEPTQINIQIPAYDDKEDYETLLRGLQKLGLEPETLKALRLIESLGANMEWQPIETAPTDGQILICGKTADGVWVFGTGSWRENLGEVAERGTLMTGYTHWMPLPETPN